MCLLGDSILQLRGYVQKGLFPMRVSLFSLLFCMTNLCASTYAQSVGGPCASPEKFSNSLPIKRALPTRFADGQLHVSSPSYNTTTSSSLPQNAFWQASRLWDNGATIRIGFIGGMPAERQMVKESAVKWLDYAKGLRFEFSDADDPNAQVSIAFNTRAGSWSYVGKDCLGYPYPQPTMNFGWLLDTTVTEEYKKATVLHEFGHLLGLMHEHLNPSPTNPIQFDEKKVIAYFSDHDGWKEDETRRNVLDHYNGQDPANSFTAFDPNSIMLYSFPGELMKNGMGTKQNYELSSADKQWAQVYYSNSVQPEGSVYDATWEMSDTYLGAKNGTDEWQWSVSMKGTGTSKVDKVIYHLHPSFNHPDITVKSRQDGFKLTGTGWGTFVIRADVYWKGISSPVTSDIPLRFTSDPTINSTERRSAHTNVKQSAPIRVNRSQGVQGHQQHN